MAFPGGVGQRRKTCVGQERGGWPQHRVYKYFEQTYYTAGPHVHTTAHDAYARPDVLVRYMAGTPSVGCSAPGPSQPRLPVLIKALDVTMGLNGVA